ncbi:MAG TPA: BadF/BadG/BcrA/BcrD ATPase family protein, partial [Clostridia bacterium]|nr:BadF/BadG/BcrA/BcrD ATPase family protein [Clostridia bacterium]
MDTGWHNVAGRQGTATEIGAGAPGRYVGIDVGAETIKIVELLCQEGTLTVGRLEVIEHGKKPGPVLLEALRGWDWSGVNGAAVSGRFSSRVNLPRIPTKQAQLAGYRFLFGQAPGTVVNIGSQGFSVLEAGTDGLTHFRENSRCSQGTGNFLRQLVERFSLTVEDAGILCAEEANPAPLSGRCPVILKTDMTHLANKGEDRARILAGLFDAVCENVLLLVKPGSSPPRVLLVGGVSRSPRVRRTFSQRLAERAMEFVQMGDLESVCLEAFGCAVAASRRPAPVSSLEHLLLPAPALKLERLQGLGTALGRVKRLTAKPMLEPGPQPGPVVVGFDVGSTGSKVLVLDAATEQVVWEDYRRTLGDPVGAAQDLLQRFIAGPAGKAPVVAFGATGSGREVTGSLLTSCFGKDSVFVVNEIVAHATGALYY